MPPAVCGKIFAINLSVHNNTTINGGNCACGDSGCRAINANLLRECTMSGGLSSDAGVGAGAGSSGGGVPSSVPPGGGGIPPAAGGGGGNPAGGGGGPPPADPPAYIKTAEFALWVEYEKVAMHFNDLNMRLRTQAVGGLAGVVAISGFAVNFAQKSGSDAQWLIFFGSLLFFMCAWVALWLLDTNYYNKLLVGAVKAIVEHEQMTVDAKSPWTITLSTRIQEAVPRHRWPVHFFYIFVLIPLVIGVFYTGYEAYEAFYRRKNAKPDPVEYQIELKTPDVLKITPDQAKIEHKVEVSVPGPVHLAPEPSRVEQQIQVKIPDGVKVISESTKSN